jgi:hypothetical protein
VGTKTLAEKLLPYYPKFEILTTFALVATLDVRIIVGGFICMALFRMYLTREQIMVFVRNMEIKIWGKPLEPEYWDKEKLK